MPWDIMLDLRHLFIIHIKRVKPDAASERKTASEIYVSLNQKVKDATKRHLP